MNREIKVHMLLTLLAAKGQPLAASTLLASVRAAFRSAHTDSDLYARLRELEREGFITGTADDLDGSHLWALTDKGRIKAQSL